MYKTYINSLTLLSAAAEEHFITNQKRTCFNGIYPYKLFPAKQLRHIALSPITIFYGGNGSGKTTLLNIIAEKAQLIRHSPYSGGAFFQEYVSGCTLNSQQIPPHSQILTSDDVFDYLLNIRCLNNGIDTRRAELFEEYVDRSNASLRFRSLKDYDDWKETYDAQTKSQSRFVKERLMRNVDMGSNGESAMRFFTSRITENALYLLDEPENSISPPLQQQLSRFISDSARYFGCQFILATHSPILLAMEDALVYDLDSIPTTACNWWELDNVRLYYDFFQQHAHLFR